MDLETARAVLLSHSRKVYTGAPAVPGARFAFSFQGLWRFLGLLPLRIH